MGHYLVNEVNKNGRNSIWRAIPQLDIHQIGSNMQCIESLLNFLQPDFIKGSVRPSVGPSVTRFFWLSKNAQNWARSDQRSIRTARRVEIRRVTTYFMYTNLFWNKRKVALSHGVNLDLRFELIHRAWARGDTETFCLFWLKSRFTPCDGSDTACLHPLKTLIPF